MIVCASAANRKQTATLQIIYTIRCNTGHIIYTRCRLTADSRGSVVVVTIRIRIGVTYSRRIGKDNLDMPC